jgi:hypothetical protein
MRSLLAQLHPYRRPIARVIGVTGVLLVSSRLFQGAPRTVQVELDLGPEHRHYVEIRVAYWQSGQELHGVAFSFPEGAPSSVQHSLRLPAGDFEVHTELRPEHGQVVASVDRLHTPTEEPVKIRVATESQ